MHALSKRFHAKSLSKRYLRSGVDENGVDRKSSTKKSKMIGLLGTSSSTIMTCSSIGRQVAFTRHFRFSGSFLKVMSTSLMIVAAIGAFWCVSRRCAVRKFVTSLSKMKCTVALLQFKNKRLNGLEMIFEIIFIVRNCGIHLTMMSVKTLCKCGSVLKSSFSIPPMSK